MDHGPRARRWRGMRGSAGAAARRLGGGRLAQGLPNVARCSAAARGGSNVTSLPSTPAVPQTRRRRAPRHKGIDRFAPHSSSSQASQPAQQPRRTVGSALKKCRPPQRPRPLTRCSSSWRRAWRSRARSSWTRSRCVAALLRRQSPAAPLDAGANALRCAGAQIRSTSCAGAGRSRAAPCLVWRWACCQLPAQLHQAPARLQQLPALAPRPRGSWCSRSTTRCGRWTCGAAARAAWPRVRPLTSPTSRSPCPTPTLLRWSWAR